MCRYDLKLVDLSILKNRVELNNIGGTMIETNKVKSIWIGIVLISMWIFTLPLGAEPERAPELNPPVIVDEHPQSVTSPKTIKPKADANAQEWTYHKTSDNQHPDGTEQEMLWYMNRARANPTQEGIWLATMDDSDVTGAISYFSVDLDVLQAEFAAISAKPPAAFDVRLYNAAKVHSDDLIARDAQDHTNQFERVEDAGFIRGDARGNVYSYTKSAVHGHAGFNIDWGGNDSTGMQDGRGHRQAIMSLDGNYTNVGIAAVSEDNTSTQVGPIVTTQNFCEARTSEANHYNQFLVGTVYEDTNSNGQYDAGEGKANVRVEPDTGSWYAITSDSGGYALPISSGTYSVTFSGGTITTVVKPDITLGSDSVLLDLVTDGSTPPDEPSATTGAASSVTSSSATLTGSVTSVTDSCNVYFEYGTTDQFGTTVVPDVSQDTGAASAPINGLEAEITYYYRLVASCDGTAYEGETMTFTTEPFTPPTITTGAASSVTSSSAVLNGDVVSDNDSCNFYFEYGTTDQFGTTVVPEISQVSGAAETALNGLDADTTYHYRLVASCDQSIVTGETLTFTTEPDNGGDNGDGNDAPWVSTGEVTSVSENSAVLAGEIVYTSETNYYFEYGISNVFGSTIPLETSQDSSDVSASINGLSPGIIYYYRLVAEWSGSKYVGDTMSFTTDTSGGQGGDSDSPDDPDEDDTTTCFVKALF